MSLTQTQLLTGIIQVHNCHLDVAIHVDIKIWADKFTLALTCVLLFAWL